MILSKARIDPILEYIHGPETRQIATKATEWMPGSTCVSSLPSPLCPRPNIGTTQYRVTHEDTYANEWDHVLFGLGKLFMYVKQTRKSVIHNINPRALQWLVD